MEDHEIEKRVREEMSTYSPNTYRRILGEDLAILLRIIDATRKERDIAISKREKDLATRLEATEKERDTQQEAIQRYCARCSTDWMSNCETRDCPLAKINPTE